MAFDLDTYVSRAGRLDIGDLDIEGGFADHPLDDDTLACLRYMHDIESHTVCYLRDLLCTQAHDDPEITTFLTMWNYEEHWHGVALARVLAAHGELAGRARVAATRAEKGWKERIRPGLFLAASAIKDFVAVELTWGMVNELTTQAGYARLAVKAEHPLLSDLLGRIRRQEGIHIDFYAHEARQAVGRIASCWQVDAVRGSRSSGNRSAREFVLRARPTS